MSWDLLIGFAVLLVLLKRADDAARWEPHRTSLAIRQAALRWLVVIVLIWLAFHLLRKLAWGPKQPRETAGAAQAPTQPRVFLFS